MPDCAMLSLIGCFSNPNPASMTEDISFVAAKAKLISSTRYMLRQGQNTHGKREIKAHSKIQHHPLTGLQSSPARLSVVIFEQHLCPTSNTHRYHHHQAAAEATK